METEIQSRDSFAGDFQRVYQLGLNDYDLDFLKFLQQHTDTGPGCRVLDIGCGVGKYAVYLARAGCDVTLLDSAPEMLALATANLREAGIPGDRWRTVCCNFHQNSPVIHSGAGDFQLSLCTMSPAVSDLVTVKKMGSLTRGVCVLAKFSASRQPRREELLQGLVPDPRALFSGTMQSDCAALVEAITAAGYSPQCRTVPYIWSDQRAPAEFASYVYRHYLAGLDPHGTLLEALCARASSLYDAAGTVVDRVETQVQWISWKTV